MSNVTLPAPDEGAPNNQSPLQSGITPPQSTDTGGPAGLSESESTWLRSFATEDEINEVAQARTARPLGATVKEVGRLAKAVLQARDLMLQRSGGKPLFSARAAYVVINEAGIYKELERPNSLGDALGNGPSGHRCPRVNLGGKNYYYIPALGKSAAEKSAMREQMKKLPKDVLRRGVAVIVPLQNDDEAVAGSLAPAPAGDGANTAGATGSPVAPSEPTSTSGVPAIETPDAGKE